MDTSANLIPGYKSLDRVMQETRDAALAAGLTNMAAGSPTRALFEHMSKQIADLHGAQHRAIFNSFLSTATGVGLDLIGRDYGLPRLGTGPIRVEQAQRFYVARGVLGDYTDGKDLGMGPGVRVTSAGGSAPIYEVLPYKDSSMQWPVWKASQSEIVVRLGSVTQGQSANTGAGTLVEHNMNKTFVLTVNPRAITAGRVIEDDESYRYRLTSMLLASYGSNATAIEHAVLELPDVDSVIVHPFSQGPGSMTVVVVPSNGSGSEDLRLRAEARVQAAIAAGERAFVRLASPVALKISLRVSSLGDPALVAANARQALTTYLGGLNTGETFVVSAAEAAVLQDRQVQDATIVALSVDGQPSPAVNIGLNAEQMFIVPAPVTQSILVDVVPS